MSSLTVFSAPKTVVYHTDDPEDIKRHLAEIGVRFEQWETNATLKAGDSTEHVLAAYQKDISRLQHDEGYQTVDVISLNSGHPQKEELRHKFLSEHTHAEDEVRFFVAGEGLFTLHINHSVYDILCRAGDLISVPALTPHWFDMGPNPNFIAIRFFNNPEGWVATYSGSDIAEHYARLSN